MVADAFSVAASGIAIFLAPGMLLLRAARVSAEPDERFAYAFAASLTLLTASFAGLLTMSLPMSSAPAGLTLTTLGACALARLLPTAAVSSLPFDEKCAAFPSFAFYALAAAAIAAAVVFAPVGSVDRWWYLAYIRSFAQAPTLSLAEPFLGSGLPFARFGVHPWLFGLAMWSQTSGIDPVAVYENAAPVVAVLASLSAATTMARALLVTAATQRLAVIASVLLWCGGVVPLLARSGEDKILAAGALVPLCFAALLRFLRGPGDARDALLLTLACVATAAVHSLDYAFVLVVAIPTAAFAFLRARHTRKVAAAAALILLVVAIVPAASGLVVRSRLHDIGAELSAADHPVVRVHEGRDRLVELPAVGYLVSPHLLLHPLVLLALFALPLLRTRRSDDGAGAGAQADGNEWVDENARAFVLVAAVLPVLIAFVPPLPVLAGSVIPPWMIYRVLWLLPVAPLAAIAMRALTAENGRGESIAAAVLLLLCAPLVAKSGHDRLAEVRGRLAAPRSEDFASVLNAVRALPAEALIVAAPELAERLPALTARHVVAALDRSTIVFAGSRSAGEARLRVRAALLAGQDDGAALAKAADVVPTHALFDPDSTYAPRCAGPTRVWGAWALCALDLRGTPHAALAIAAFPPPRIVAEARCDPAAPSSGRDPWSASAPLVDCRVKLPAGTHEGLFLLVEASTGRAADELRITVASTALAVARVSGESSTAIALPPIDDDTIDVRVASSFLPFVKVRRVAVLAR